MSYARSERRVFASFPLFPPLLPCCGRFLFPYWQTLFVVSVREKPQCLSTWHSPEQESVRDTCCLSLSLSLARSLPLHAVYAIHSNSTIMALARRRLDERGKSIGFLRDLDQTSWDKPSSSPSFLIPPPHSTAAACSSSFTSARASVKQRQQTAETLQQRPMGDLT